MNSKTLNDFVHERRYSADIQDAEHVLPVYDLVRGRMMVSFVHEKDELRVDPKKCPHQVFLEFCLSNRVHPSGFENGHLAWFLGIATLH